MKPEDLVKGNKYQLLDSRMFFDRQKIDEDGNSKWLDGNQLTLIYDSCKLGSFFGDEVMHYIFFIQGGELDGRDLGMRIDCLTKNVVEYDDNTMETITSFDDV